MGVTIGSDRPSDLGTRRVPESAGFPTEPRSLQGGRSEHRVGEVPPGVPSHGHWQEPRRAEPGKRPQPP